MSDVGDACSRPRYLLPVTTFPKVIVSSLTARLARLLLERAETQDAPSSRRYRAVEITPGRQACAAAASHAGRRFLCAEAPLLPLSECDRPDGCQCLYRHFLDRRQSERRQEPDFLARPRNGSEQRARSGRRAEDKADDPLEDTYFGYMSQKRRNEQG